MTPLSKSSFILGSNCERALWLRAHRPELETDRRDAAQIAQGEEVGAFARASAGTHVMVSPTLSLQGRVRATAEYIASDAAVICEATFLHEGTLCMVDLLVREADGWAIIEVKSSIDDGADTLDDPGPALDRYLDDVAFQYRVVSATGLHVTSASLMRIDHEYRANASRTPDLARVFRQLDVTTAVLTRQPTIVAEIERLREVSSSSVEPGRTIGRQCFEPYECGFRGHCWAGVPEPNVYDLPGMRKTRAEELRAKGLVSFPALLSSNEALSEKHLMVMRHHVEALPPRIDLHAIRTFLTALSYPVSFLDFETTRDAVPRWPGAKPYQQVPFQYSLHIQHRPHATPEHRECLAPEGTDPRRAIADALVRDIPTEGSVVTWNKTFELSRLSELSKTFPDLADQLASIQKRVIDLGAPFRTMAYYDSRFGGSWSIKAVLPVLYPDDRELSYDMLDRIHNGGEASEAYRRLDRVTDPEERSAIRDALLAYCRLDTLATVKILEFLQSVADQSRSLSDSHGAAPAR